MKKEFRCYKHPGTVYLGQDITREGFLDMERISGYANAFTLTLVKPNVTLQQIRRSLKTVLEDIEMRIEAKEDKNPPSNAKPAGPTKSNTSHKQHFPTVTYNPVSLSFTMLKEGDAKGGL